MAVETRIFVTTRFAALHRWPKAPEAVEFLSDPHRHLFHVHVELIVHHDDRELEFLTVKSFVDDYLRALPFDLGAKSCEMIALDIGDVLIAIYGLRLCKVEVSEDGENGAIVEWTDG